MSREGKMDKAVFIEPWIKPSKQMCNIGTQHWSVTRLIDAAKDLEVFELPLKSLDLGDTTLYRPREFVTHMRAVMDADLKYPIILDEDGELMDGRHRILKALYLNKKTIKAVRFDDNPAPCKVD